MQTHQAFDKMLKHLEIKAQDICERSGVSKSRLSQFRNGKGSDVGVRSLDQMLDAAESIHPQARQVFANFLGGGETSIEEMSLKEKGDLIIALARSIKTTETTAHKSLLTVTGSVVGG